MRTADPHLQAKLLLEFSELAVSLEAKTEEAIDFLFSFLQNGSKDPNDGVEGSKNNGAGGGGNAVVVGAVVRSLRQLLKVKPSFVEPMVQCDAMSEQLMQCISVPEDCKLRRDMLSIVLDCLFNSRNFAAIERLLVVCLEDHDDLLKVVCLRGYARLLASGHRLSAAAMDRMLERLAEVLVDGSEHGRVASVELLGHVTTAVFDPVGTTLSVLPTVVHALATASRDPSIRVRQAAAVALRSLRSHPEEAYAHLFQKKQITEELSDLETSSKAMLASGAALTLLEDNSDAVVVEMSTTMRVLCDAGAWSLELLDRAIVSHIEILGYGRSGSHCLEQVLASLRQFLMTRARQSGGEPFDVSREELLFMLGRLGRFSIHLARPMLLVLQFCAIDHPLAASHVVSYLNKYCDAYRAERVVEPMVVDATSLHEAFTILNQKLSALGTPLSTGNQRVLLDVGFGDEVGKCESGSQTTIPSPSFLANRSTLDTRCVNRDKSFQHSVATVERCLHQLQHGSNRPSQQVYEDLLRSSRNVYVRCHEHLNHDDQDCLTDIMFAVALRLAAGSSTHVSSARALKEELQAIAHRSRALEILDQDAPHTIDEVDLVLHRLLEDFSIQGFCGRLASVSDAASATIHDPQAAATVDATIIEVLDHCPSYLVVRCSLEHVPHDAQAVVEVKLPNGDSMVAPLQLQTRSTRTRITLAEATLTLRLKPFSDPAPVMMSVGLKSAHAFPRSQAADLYTISEAATVLLHHRGNLPRHQATRNG